MSSLNLLLFTCIFSFITCINSNTYTGKNEILAHLQTENLSSKDSLSNVVHILVALCDNQYQGIVKVPERIGNGQNPKTNLYWGCGYGIKTFFKKSSEWVLLKSIPYPNSKSNDSIIMERLIFKHKINNYHLIADAYNGQFIANCTSDFLLSNSGQMKDTLQINQTVIGINGNAKLLAYIGHNGLMDFDFNGTIANSDSLERSCMILACYSKSYFKPFILKAKSNPLLWTNGLMCPEAYTIHDAINSFLKKKSGKEIKETAANTYNKYQKCGLNGANRLMSTGF